MTVTIRGPLILSKQYARTMLTIEWKQYQPTKTINENTLPPKNWKRGNTLQQPRGVARCSLHRTDALRTTKSLFKMGGGGKEENNEEPLECSY